MEVWKDVNGYQGLYQISNLGKVKSVGYCKYVFTKGHAREKIYIRRELLLKPTDNGNGYLIVPLNKNGKRKNHYVHRLVAEHFIKNPHNKNCVNHIDYNKKNNCVNNLEWVTQKENVNHSSWKMKGLKKRCKISSTGEKYITKKNGVYRVNVKLNDTKVDKTFKTLEAALSFRNEVLNGIGITV